MKACIQQECHVPEDAYEVEADILMKKIYGPRRARKSTNEVPEFFGDFGIQTPFFEILAFKLQKIHCQIFLHANNNFTATQTVVLE